MSLIVVSPLSRIAEIAVRHKAREMINVLLAAMEAHTGKRPIIYTDITFYREIIKEIDRG